MNLPNDTLLQGGRYRILKTLGQGGFGITYLAEQTMMHRQVCIKEFFVDEKCGRDSSTSQVYALSQTFGGFLDSYLRKFVREAQTIARLDHPNIVKIFDAFEENGTAYYVMEYLEGKSLKELVRDGGRLAQDKALEYITKAGEALEYVHSKKIMHLDVKPSNIMLTNEGKVILIDFGVAKNYDEVGLEKSHTPVAISRGYAPLEQYIAGGVSKFCPQSDIYSLAATLYTLLTGETPTEAPMLSTQGLVFPEFVPDKIASAVTRAMELKVSDRPASVGEFLTSLSPGADTFQNEKPAPEPEKVPPKKQEPQKPTPRKTEPEKEVPKIQEPQRRGHKKLWIAIGVFLVAIAVLLYFTSDRWEARRSIDYYKYLVSRCLDNINSGSDSNYQSLLEAKNEFSSIQYYDAVYYKYFPRIYQESSSLQDELDSKLNEAGEAWARIAYRHHRYGERNEALESYEIANQLYESHSFRTDYENLIKSMAYMKIIDLEFKNSLDNNTISDWGEPLISSEMRYLHCRIKYDGLSDDSHVVTLKIKIFEPDGWLKSGSSSPFGYTFEDNDCTVNHGTDLSLTLLGWGNEEGGTYYPGSYRYEIWYDGERLFSKNFEIK